VNGPRWCYKSGGTYKLFKDGTEWPVVLMEIFRLIRIPENWRVYPHGTGDVQNYHGLIDESNLQPALSSAELASIRYSCRPILRLMPLRLRMSEAQIRALLTPPTQLLSAV